MPKTVAYYPGLFYHRVNEDGMIKMEKVRRAVLHAAEEILTHCPASRELSLAMTHLEDVSRCAIAGIAIAYGEMQLPVGYHIERNTPHPKEK